MTRREMQKECLFSHEEDEQNKTIRVDQTNLNRLTVGEDLLLKRRHLGMTQEETATLPGHNP